MDNTAVAIKNELERLSQSTKASTQFQTHAHSAAILLKKIRNLPDHLENWQDEYVEGAGLYVWFLFQDNDYATAIVEGQKLLAEMEHLDNPKLSQLLRFVSVSLMKHNQPDEALAHLHKAYILQLQHDEDGGIPRVMTSIAMLYRQIDEPQQAIEWYKKALAEYTNLADEYGLFVTHNNLMNGHIDMEDFEEAIAEGQACLTLFAKSKEQNRQGITTQMRTASGYVHNNLGKAWLGKGKKLIKPNNIMQLGLPLTEK